MSVSVIRYSAVCLMAGSFLSSSAYADYDCTKSPDCASLGYTMSADECAEDAIKVACPTDLSKFFCKKKPVCSGTIGDILFGDGSCSSEMISGKIPIGIVFDVENRLVVALTDVTTSAFLTMYWSANNNDVPGLDNCINVMTCGVDGQANTIALLNCGSSCGSTPAATATNNYEPNGCSKDFCKKTKWFLPSMRDLAKIYANKSVVNASLSLLSSFGAKTLTESYYWSSTERHGSNAWTFNMNSGGRGYISKYDYYIFYVRPVVKY